MQVLAVDNAAQQKKYSLPVLFMQGLSSNSRTHSKRCRWLLTLSTIYTTDYVAAADDQWWLESLGSGELSDNSMVLPRSLEAKFFSEVL